MALNDKMVCGPAPLPVPKKSSPLYKHPRRVNKGVGTRDLVKQ